MKCIAHAKSSESNFIQNGFFLSFSFLNKFSLLFFSSSFREVWASKVLVEFKTTFSPDREEIVYCEKYYEKEIY